MSADAAMSVETESPAWASTASSTIVSSGKGENPQHRSVSVEWGAFVIQAFALSAAGQLLKKRLSRERKKVKERFARVLEELRRRTV